MKSPDFKSQFLAQNLSVATVSPANQRTNAEPSEVIRVNFDQALDPATVVAANFKVFGRWSGPTAVSINLSNDNKTVELLPQQPLMYGE